MTRLEELVYKLTAVIIRYHDKQTHVKALVVDNDKNSLKNKIHACADEILKCTKPDYKTRLEDLIKSCTEQSPRRQHFLKFLLHEIVFIQTQLDRNTAYNSDEFIRFQEQMNQLFTDLKKLMSTTKSNVCAIHHSNLEKKVVPSVKLQGLVNNGYTGGELCNSGIILNEEVFSAFQLFANSSPTSTNQLVEQMCTELQNSLLVAELSTKNAKLSKQNAELKNALEILSAQQEATQKHLGEIASQLQVAENTISLSNANLKHMTELLALSKAKEKELLETNSSQQRAITQLTYDNRRLRDLTTSEDSEDLSDSDPQPTNRSGFFGSIF